MQLVIIISSSSVMNNTLDCYVDDLFKISLKFFNIKPKDGLRMIEALF